MTSWRKAMVLAALVILIGAAYDLLVVDFWLPVFCEDADSSTSYAGEDCFCCCAHIVPSPSTDVQPDEISSIAEFVQTPLWTATEFTRIYHPPRI
jgi:hypothetical protein